MNPKISFVMPTHNRIEWMPACLQSLMDQTEKDIEIIVVNDNSTDGTREFLDEFSKIDERIKVIHNETNQGGGRSRNIGMEAATAAIVCVCDDDDSYPEDRAEITLQWFNENPTSELVNFPYIRVGYFDEQLEHFFGGDFDHDAFKKDGTVSYFCNPSVAFKKASVVEVGGYPAETKELTDDIQFVKNWIGAGKKIDFDKRAFACLHRVLPNSMMVKNRGWNPDWVTK
jgi:glycosyltransferase involved in cell wall biosynthesis